MLDRDDMTVTALATLIGRPVSTVSKAINHARYPRVRAKILEVLNA